MVTSDFGPEKELTPALKKSPNHWEHVYR